MGGRSRRSHQLTDRWAWIAELSTERFNNYAQYSRIQTIRDYATGVRTSASDLNFHMAKHFESKHGYEPDWAVWRQFPKK